VVTTKTGLKFRPLWRVASLIRGGDRGNVIAACEDELSREPGNGVVRKWLALAYEETGASDKAVDQALALLRSDADDELALRVAASSLAKLGRNEEAIAYVRSYLRVAGPRAARSRWWRVMERLSYDESARTRSRWLAWARDFDNWYRTQSGQP
jgi:tetratricopeptide (TPR) repeat protein